MSGELRNSANLLAAAWHVPALVEDDVRNGVSKHGTVLDLQFNVAFLDSETVTICRSMLFHTAKRYISYRCAQL